VKVRVRFFGSLRDQLPADEREQGRDVGVPDGSTVLQLLAHLGIGTGRGAVATREGHIMRGDEVLEDGQELAVFQMVSGG
jgi:sulfur carrier protein ThiS